MTCARCGGGWMPLNEDGDPACLMCGWIFYADLAESLQYARAMHYARAYRKLRDADYENRRRHAWPHR